MTSDRLVFPVSWWREVSNILQSVQVRI